MIDVHDQLLDILVILFGQDQLLDILFGKDQLLDTLFDQDQLLDTLDILFGQDRRNSSRRFPG